MSLTWKIFLGTALVVTAVLGGTLVVADRSATQVANEAIGRSLEATSEQISTVLTGRQASLRNAANVFAQNPGFRSIIEKQDRSSALDQAMEAVTQTGATFVQITDDQGIRLARSDDPSASPADLSTSALIGGALEGKATNGFLATDTSLAQVIAVPIVQGDSVSRTIGTLMAAQTVNSGLIRSVQVATGGDVEVIFFLQRENGTRHVVANTFSSAAVLDPVLKATNWVPDAAGRVPRSELMVGDVHYVGQGGLVRSASGNPLGGYLALRSRDAAFSTFLVLRRTLLIGGGVGLLVAFLLSFVVASTITRPVSALAKAAKRAADGDYAAEIAGTGNDEIGRLGAAFRALMSDLREKQELVELMQSGDGRRTVPMEALGSTLQMHAATSGALVPGQKFARRYDVKEVLGAGGMGMVYKALDTELGELVAIKTLKADFAAQDAQALERFRSEIRLARKISHRNVVRTHDIGDVDGQYYITMEYAEGKSLKDLIRQRGPLPVPAVVTIGKQLCRALEVAHDAGVIHRDIKPQNIILGADGVLKVMDFGIARLAVRQEGVTQAGMVVGTPEYMAPEQLLGDDVDPRVDLYAAGAVLYECLTGRLPHEAESAITLIAKVLEETPVPPDVLVPEVPAKLSALVMQALLRDRDGRPESAAAMHDLLEADGITGLDTASRRTPLTSPAVGARG